MKFSLPKGLKTKKHRMKVLPIKRRGVHPMHTGKYYKKPAHITQLQKEARAAQFRIMSHGMQAHALGKMKHIPSRKLLRQARAKTFHKFSAARKISNRLRKLFGGIKDGRKHKC